MFTVKIVSLFSAEPESPRNVKVSDVKRNSMKISWVEPLEDGGSPIKGYIIESRTPYNPRWSKVTHTPVKGFDYTWNDVMEGEEREVRVIAVNEAGYSKPSASTPLVKVKDPFGMFTDNNVNTACQSEGSVWYVH